MVSIAALAALIPFVATARNAPCVPEKICAEHLANPPHSARPHIWWHWVDGHVTPEGILADLDAFAEVGIGGVHIFNVGGVVTPPKISEESGFDRLSGRPAVQLGSTEWFDLLRFAMAEARKRGIEVIWQVTPGWATMGGPWIAPDDGMRRVGWSISEAVQGASRVSMELRYPIGYGGHIQESADAAGTDTRPTSYEDIAILAVQPSSGNDGHQTSAPRLTSNFAVSTAALSTLIDGRSGTAKSDELGKSTIGKLSLEPHLTGDDVVIEYIYPGPQVINGLEIGLFQADYFQGLEVRFEVMREGKWQLVRAFDLHALQSSVTDPLRSTFTFHPVEGRHFRLVLRAAGHITEPATLYEARPITRHHVDGWESKAGLAPLAAALRESLDSPPPATILKTIDLTDQVDADGMLDWQAPAGTWRILRFGSVLTGEQVGPAAPGGDGPEGDKLAADALDKQITHFLDPVVQTAAQEPGALTGLLTDSWEANSQTWTPGLADLFEERYGYSLLNWLPALTGEIVEDAERTERFLFDYRLLLSDLAMQHTYAGLAAYARRNGLKLYGEAPGIGTNAPIDRYAALGQVDVPMAEFWHQDVSEEQIFQEGDVRAAASAAMLYDRKVAAAEAFTSIESFSRFTYAPRDYKLRGDREFANGINKFILHSAVHQPYADLVPGLQLFDFGANFNRHEPWFRSGGKEWIGYLTRTQSVLQQGRQVADVFYFLGNDVPNGQPHKQQLLPALPQGFSAVAGGSRELLTRVAATNNTPANGEAVVPVVVLPQSDRVTLPVARRLEQLVREGVTLVGPPFLRGRSMGELGRGDAEIGEIALRLWGEQGSRQEGGVRVIDRPVGKGRVVDGLPLSDILGIAAFEPEGEWPNVLFHQRVLASGETVFYLSNQSRERQAFVGRFRVSGLVPELWHPETATASEILVFEQAGDVMRLPVEMMPGEAFFVIFREGVREPAVLVGSQGQKIDMANVLAPQDGARLRSVGFSRELTARAKDQVLAIPADWKLRPVNVPASGPWLDGTLAELSASDLVLRPENPGLLRYSAQFELADMPSGANESIVLDLGEVGVSACVRVNRIEAGCAWHRPFEIDIGAAVQSGTNDLEIVVSPTLANWLISQTRLPASERNAWASHWAYDETSAPIPSGLVGPARILRRSLSPFLRLIDPPSR
jgi:hypothetical protein